MLYEVITMLWGQIGAIVAFIVAVLAVGLKTFRRTLD